MIAETVADTDGQTLGILKYKICCVSVHVRACACVCVCVCVYTVVSTLVERVAVVDDVVVSGRHHVATRFVHHGHRRTVLVT